MVAIKKFKETEDNPIIRKIALWEVRALKSLHHDNIVEFKKAFWKDQKLNIVFEFLPWTILDEIE